MKIKVGTIAVVSYVTVVQNLLKRLSIYVPLVFSRQKVPNSDLDPKAEPESKDYRTFQNSFYAEPSTFP